MCPFLNVCACFLEEQIENNDTYIISDSDDNSNEELNIKGKDNYNDDLNFLIHHPQVYCHLHTLQIYTTIIHHKMKIMKRRIRIREERKVTQA